MTTLGWLKHLRDPKWEFFEWQYLNVIHKFLTDRWWILQSGSDDEALQQWILVMKILELDNKAKRDLFLLAQSGIVGRGHANKILWRLLTNEALDPAYQDLSRLVTNFVYAARRDFDRPPREHADLRWWGWRCYSSPWRRDLRWLPTAVPTVPWDLCLADGGEPLPPPRCFAPAAQNMQ